MRFQVFTDGKYYYAADVPVCDGCSQELVGLAWHFFGWHKKGSGRGPLEMVYCHSCFDSDDAHGADAVEYHPVVVERPPRGAMPYLPTPPNLSPSKSGSMSLFDAVSYAGGTNDSPADVIDRTVCAGRPEYTLEGPQHVLIGAPSVGMPSEADALEMITGVPITPELLEDKR